MIISILLALLLPLVFFIFPITLSVNGGLSSQDVFASIPITAWYPLDVMVARTSIELSGYLAFLNGHWEHTVIVTIVMFATWLLVGMIVQDRKNVLTLVGFFALGGAVIILIFGWFEPSFYAFTPYTELVISMASSMLDVEFWIEIVCFIGIALTGSSVGMLKKLNSHDLT